VPSAGTGARVALVTAGNAGLARGVVVTLARDGYRTAFTYRNGGTGPDGTLAAVRAGGSGAFAVPADFAKRGDGSAAIAAVEQHFGRLDVLVHAIGPIIVRRFEKLTLADYDAIVTANLASAVECAAAALPGMRARGFGRLVFFGMNGSRVTQPGLGMSLYAAAKAGLTAFARTLSLEEAKYGVTVNTVEPGDIRNKDADRAAARAIVADNPTGHAGSWEDIAYAVRFLVADEAEFINGATIGVNGGLVDAYE
jgi:3-oxoacyl-[acyl-carrier protein] reductase